MTLESFLYYLDHPRRTARGHVASCPAHADRRPSLAVFEGDDRRILVCCRAGYSTEEIVESLGLSLADLFPGKQAEGFQTDMYRNAEKVIAAATGVDISGWLPEELDQVWDALAEAYERLREEKAYEYQPC